MNNSKNNVMTKEQAYGELAKVAAVYKMLENGAISTMSDADVEKVLKWID